MIKKVHKNFLKVDLFKEEIMALSVERFKIISERATQFDNACEEDIKRYTAPIQICVFEYSETFQVIIEEYQKQPMNALLYITDKIPTIMKHSVQKDYEKAGYYFKELYLRHVRAKTDVANPNPMIYSQLISSYFYTIKSELQNPNQADFHKILKARDLLVNETKELMLEFKDFDLLCELCDLVKLDEIISYVLKIHESHRITKDQLMNMFIRNNIDPKMFLIEILFYRNSVNQELQYLNEFMYMIMSEYSSNLEEFQQSEFHDDLLRRLISLKAYNGQDPANGGFIPYLIIPFLMRICTPSRHTQKLALYVGAIREFIKKDFCKDVNIWKLIVKFCAIDKRYSEDNIAKYFMDETRDKFLTELFSVPTAPQAFK